MPFAGAVLLCVIVWALPASADEAGEANEASFAMQLSNPVAGLIGAPLQFNCDQDIGPADDGAEGVGARISVSQMFPR